MKVLKYGKIAILKNPKNLFLKNSTIKFQFDMFHGVGHIWIKLLRCCLPKIKMILIYL